MTVFERRVRPMSGNQDRNLLQAVCRDEALSRVIKRIPNGGFLGGYPSKTSKLYNKNRDDWRKRWDSNPR
jgi:hypothetical protein